MVSKKIKKFNKKRFIEVHNTTKFLEELGIAKRKLSKAKIIAVTGSSGKTTVKTILGNILNNFGKTYFSPKSYNNHYGVPLSLANLENNHKYGVFDGYYEETLKLSTTLYANKFSNVHKLIKTLPGWKKNSKGKIRSGYSVKKHPDGIQDFWMKLEIDEDENKLYLLVLDTNKELFDKTVFWSFEDIEDSFMTKLSKSVFINADVKTENGKEYFLYTDAIFIEPTFRDFINGLENGLIRFDHKYSPDKSGPTEGKFHDHGSGFRINKKEDFKMLFSNIVEVS